MSSPGFATWDVFLTDHVVYGTEVVLYPAVSQCIHFRTHLRLFELVQIRQSSYRSHRGSIRHGNRSVRLVLNDRVGALLCSRLALCRLPAASAAFFACLCTGFANCVTSADPPSRYIYLRGLTKNRRTTGSGRRQGKGR